MQECNEFVDAGVGHPDLNHILPEHHIRDCGETKEKVEHRFFEQGARGHGQVPAVHAATVSADPVPHDQHPQLHHESENAVDHSALFCAGGHSVLLHCLLVLENTRQEEGIGKTLWLSTRAACHTHQGVKVIAAASGATALTVLITFHLSIIASNLIYIKYAQKSKIKTDPIDLLYAKNVTTRN